jgi:hypothetical protein
MKIIKYNIPTAAPRENEPICIQCIKVAEFLHTFVTTYMEAEREMKRRAFPYINVFCTLSCTMYNTKFNIFPLQPQVNDP